MTFVIESERVMESGVLRGNMRWIRSRDPPCGVFSSLCQRYWDFISTSSFGIVLIVY